MTFLVYAKDTDRGGGEMRPLPVFVYLEGECPDGGVVDVRTPTGYGHLGRPAVWEVAKDPAQQTLAKVASGECSWGALFWAPLMAAVDDEVIREWQRLRDEKAPEGQRAALTAVALTFAEPVGDRPAWDRVLKGVDMTESPFINSFIELGEMRASREALIDAIKFRFPEMLTPDIERAIADQPDLGLLRAWRAAVYASPTADDFLKVLRR
jgi:hypothetical protein